MRAVKNHVMTMFAAREGKRVAMRILTVHTTVLIRSYRIISIMYSDFFPSCHYQFIKIIVVSIFFSIILI